jgi:hypothetical protein
MLSTVMTMRTIATLIALALLAGCGGDDDGGSQGAYGSAARLSEPVTFKVIGGDAFRDDTVTVQPDGSVRVETRAGEHSGKLSADERDELARAVERADLAAAESATTRPPEPDMLSYLFDYRGREVETDSPALPEQLAPLVRTFMELIDAHGP